MGWLLHKAQENVQDHHEGEGASVAIDRGDLGVRDEFFLGQDDVLGCLDIALGEAISIELDNLVA